MMIMSASEEYQLPGEGYLRKLSRRAVVAYATCAARMVQPLFGCGKYRPHQTHIEAVDEAIRIAELFAAQIINDATGFIKGTYDAAYDAAAIATRADAARIAADAAKADADAHSADTARATATTAYSADIVRTVAHSAYSFNRAVNASIFAAIYATNAARTAYSATADDDIRFSLCRIYELLKKYDQDNDAPIDFRQINIWENSIPPRWFIDTIQHNKELAQHWEDNNLNPWNMLELSKGYSDETFHIPQPHFRVPPPHFIPAPHFKPATIEEKFAFRDSVEVFVEPIPLSTPPPKIEIKSVETTTQKNTQAGNISSISSNLDDSNKPCGGITEVAGALRDILVYSKDSLCVGILGQWGGGKSRLMKEVAEHFEDTQEIERFVTIQYNAWEYRNAPESWAYLYECFAKKLRETSWFAMIRAGIVRHGLWPLILALFLVSLPWFVTSFLDETVHNQHSKWWPIILGIVGYGGGCTTMFGYFLTQILQSASTIQKRYLSLPKHNDKLGPQAAIGQDFHALICGWTTIKTDEKYFIGQTRTLEFVQFFLHISTILLYGTLL